MPRVGGFDSHQALHLGFEMATAKRYDQLIKNSDTDPKNFGQDINMKSAVKIEFLGNLPGFIDFMEKTFKNPNDVIFVVGSPGDSAFIPERVQAAINYLKKMEPQLAISKDVQEAVKAFIEGFPEVENLLRDGMKINAIKRVRELTNCGLKTAKDIVEGVP